MALRTGKCILAKDIRLDREYKNILNYSESQMVTLVQSKAVYSATNCSFIREGANELKLDVAYGTAIQANYLAFQNPDYSNKWFFAFIDSVDYISNGVTKITFTVDECATWFDYWTVQPCFVIREHTNDDTVGNNTIPEGLEHGEYISNGFTRDNNMSDLGYILQATEHYNYNPDQGNTDGQTATAFGGVLNAGTAFYFPDTSAGQLDLLTCIGNYASAGKSEAITNVYVIPSVFVGNKESITAQHNWWSGMWSPEHYDVTITKQSTVDGYTPKNNKLLTKEYNFLVLDNNAGTSNTLAYEDFSTTNCVFEVVGVPTCGGSIKCVPKDYKGETRFQQEGITAGKFPVCGWVNDVYTNWLTQQSVNLNNGLISAGAGLVIGAGLVATGVGATAGAGIIGASIAGGVGAVTSNMIQKMQHPIMPQTASGNVNSGDVTTCYDMNKFYFIKMSIKAQFARQLDDFFTRFGYKTNRLKIPNQTGRTYWNFVQIADGEDIGEPTATISVPSKSMDIINNAYRKGVTIWHDHANIGNYALTNSIVSS